MVFALHRYFWWLVVFVVKGRYNYQAVFTFRLLLNDFSPFFFNPWQHIYRHCARRRRGDFSCWPIRANGGKNKEIGVLQTSSGITHQHRHSSLCHLSVHLNTILPILKLSSNWKARFYVLISMCPTIRCTQCMRRRSPYYRTAQSFERLALWVYYND